MIFHRQHHQIKNSLARICQIQIENFSCSIVVRQYTSDVKYSLSLTISSLICTKQIDCISDKLTDIDVNGPCAKRK
jgi:hypothetical protein